MQQLRQTNQIEIALTRERKNAKDSHRHIARETRISELNDDFNNYPYDLSCQLLIHLLLGLFSYCYSSSTSSALCPSTLHRLQFTKSQTWSHQNSQNTQTYRLLQMISDN